MLAAFLLVLTACGGGGGDGASSDASLSLLRIDGAALVPAFDPGATSYVAGVVWATDSTRVTAVTGSASASLAVNGVATPSGVPSQPIALPVGETEISIRVTAEDGTMRTYRVTVTRPPAGTDATLSDLVLTAGPLLQPFDPALASYDASFGHLAASTRVLATPTDPLADGLAVNGVDVPVGAASLPVALPVGVSTLTVAVTAEDRVTQAIYDVTATRADFATLAQSTYVKSTNTDDNDRFGFDVGLADDRLLVTAPFEQSAATGVDGNQSDDTLSSAGAAYLFERAGGVWTASHYLKASNTDSFDRFGWSAAADEVLLVGAPGEQSLSGSQTDNSGNRVGAAYVFDPAAGAPVQTAYLKASNPDSLDEFGSAAITSGGWILIGAPMEASSASGVNGDEADNSLVGAGAAYLFERSGNDWVQTAYLKASNTGSGTDNQFGIAVGLSGNTLAVGAWREDSGATGINGNQTDTSQPNAGAVYVFDRTPGGTWSQTAYVKASNTGTDHNFGASLALDGDLLAVGAPGENTAAQNAGAVYVFARNSAGTWRQEALLRPQTAGLNDFFGTDVALVGTLLAVGAPGESSDAQGINGSDGNQNAVDSGAIYLFERQAGGAWQQIAFVKASNTDAGDLFGAAFALAGDTLAAGAPGEQSNATGVDGNQASNANANAGAVYIVR